MDPALRAQLEKGLPERCTAVAEGWYQAIAGTSYLPAIPAEIRQRLASLAVQAAALLIGEPPDGDNAASSRQIGAALAQLHCLQPEGLGRAIGILARGFVEGLPIDQAMVLHPGLAVLIEGVAAGFAQQVRETILSEQESIRGALVGELKATEKALRESGRELELRVEERTAELARTNEELRLEIAERKRVEEALRESEATARALLNAPTDLVALADSQGILLDVNEAYARRFGRSPNELIGKCWWDWLPPDVVERRKPYFEAVLRSGEPLFFEDERLGQWFDNRVYPVCDGDGKVIRIALVARDITDHKQVLQALRESEERWRSLVENAPDIVVTVDREGQILFTNRGRLGRPADSYVGLNITDWAAPEMRERLKQSIEKVFAQGSTDYLEMPAVLSDGASAWFANHLGPIRRDGEVVAAMIISHDITERRQVEEIKDNLIRDVSHELRTPLAKMQMSLDLLLEVLDKEPINRQRASSIGQMIFGNVQRLLQTVETILDLSILESGRIVYERVQISPAALIDDALQYMQPWAKAKGLELVASAPADLPPIEGDWEQLSRVLVNLVDNAIKFSERGQIVISAQEYEREIQFAVSDQGFGVHKENLGKVFDRFFQERPQSSGAGVGLPICRVIVQAHGGRIWAESPGRGQGATVRFALAAGSKGAE
ncbi:MAG: PAS domain-containing protein [Anaerolineae bacterium]|nr:PAS domain-containing protein [Anaerolineae bacterium]